MLLRLSRAQVVSISLLTGSGMLNPTFLSLPAGVQGVPFLMALVIGHMAINGLLLIVSLVRTAPYHSNIPPIATRAC